jgi:hypothetical protein
VYLQALLISRERRKRERERDEKGIETKIESHRLLGFPAAMAAARSAALKTPARSAAARFVQSRLRSSGGKMFSEEEKAAENVYIKV